MISYTRFQQSFNRTEIGSHAYQELAVSISLSSASDSRSRTFGRRRLGAGVWAPPFGRTAVWAPDVWAPALMREEIGFYRHYHYFINTVMKMTRVSLQSKLDGLISMLTRILR